MREASRETLTDPPRNEGIMKSFNLYIVLSALLALAGVAPRAQAQAGTETLTLIDSSCTTAMPCTLQLYRAALPAGTTSCPSPAASAWTALTTNLGSPTVGTVNSAWVYADSTLGSGTTYCYYATVTFVAGGSACRPSAFFEVAVPVLAPAAAPTITGTYGPGSTPAKALAAARMNVTPSPAKAPTISGTYKSPGSPASTPVTARPK